LNTPTQFYLTPTQMRPEQNDEAVRSGQVRDSAMSEQQVNAKQLQTEARRNYYIA